MRKIATLIAAAAIAVVGLASPANATNQPYGGCKEAHVAPKSAGANWCRSHGWFVTSRLVVTPKHTVAYSTLPHCTEEDGSSGPLPCSWNFDRSDGNGIGRVYWIDIKGHTHYLLRPRPPAKVAAQTCIDQRFHLDSRLASHCRYWGWGINRTYVVSPTGKQWDRTTSWRATRPMSFDDTLPMPSAAVVYGSVCLASLDIYHTNANYLPDCPAPRWMGNIRIVNGHNCKIREDRHDSRDNHIARCPRRTV